MKTKVAVLSLAVIALILFISFRHDQARIYFWPKQGCGLTTLRGGYQSWAVEWSYGEYANGKIAWHVPKYIHADLRGSFWGGVISNGVVISSNTAPSGATTIVIHP